MKACGRQKGFGGSRPIYLARTPFGRRDPTRMSEAGPDMGTLHVHTNPSLSQPVKELIQEAKTMQRSMIKSVIVCQSETEADRSPTLLEEEVPFPRKALLRDEVTTPSAMDAVCSPASLPVGNEGPQAMVL
ncbi:hypothetical protein QJS10_CPB17g00368 [Acorus calamus]|uniref:Uncharacterized protein n=1 Tax=Acorus calamus TaxID=4465 RepID=A0AAV9CUM2_ACOCL|nr:hypothetical protein QJS10_CPB17g00368 [Acorus calamus]